MPLSSIERKVLDAMITVLKRRYYAFEIVKDPWNYENGQWQATRLSLTRGIYFFRARSLKKLNDRIIAFAWNYQNQLDQYEHNILPVLQQFYPNEQFNKGIEAWHKPGELIDEAGMKVLNKSRVYYIGKYKSFERIRDKQLRDNGHLFQIGDAVVNLYQQYGYPSLIAYLKRNQDNELMLESEELPTTLYILDKATLGIVAAEPHIEKIMERIAFLAFKTVNEGLRTFGNKGFAIAKYNKLIEDDASADLRNLAMLGVLMGFSRGGQSAEKEKAKTEKKQEPEQDQEDNKDSEQADPRIAEVTNNDDTLSNERKAYKTADRFADVSDIRQLFWSFLIDTFPYNLIAVGVMVFILILFLLWQKGCAYLPEEPNPIPFRQDSIVRADSLAAAKDTLAIIEPVEREDSVATTGDTTHPDLPEPERAVANFYKGHSSIISINQVIIEKISRYLQDSANSKIVVIGFSSGEGDSSFNQWLSLKRARVFADLLYKDHLEKLGITKDRIAIRGMGDSTPLDTNGSEEGKSRNRRVEVLAVSKDAQWYFTE